MAVLTHKFTDTSLDNKNKYLFFKLSIIFFLLTINLNAQVIIKEKVEINPQRIVQPENGIGGDSRNPCYIRYGGEVVLRSIYQTNQSFELWEENLGKIIPGSEIQLGTFPQWHKFIFYLFNTATGEKFYPDFGDIITEYSTIDFYPSHIPGEPLPWNPEDWWEIEIYPNTSLAAMPPPEILNYEDVTNPFLPAGEVIIPLPGNFYAVITEAATQNDALWIDKPNEQLIMDELGSHIDDTLFFGQMNVGDTLRFFLRSPKTIVNGMNLYPRINTYEEMMPGGEIFLCRLDFEDWTDQLFDDVNIEIYLQPDSGAYAGPIAIFFEPEQIGPNDTTTITFKYRHLDGTLEDIDPSRTFEVGLIDGCTLGILKTETDSGVYINDVYQPIHFIADSSADSGTVMIRAGLITGGASKMISGNLKQDVTAETNTAKRYDILINKNQTTTNKINNNNEVLGDNPGSEFCHLEYYTQTFGVGSLAVGKDCKNYPCAPGYQYSPPEIVSEIEDIIWSNSFTNENGTTEFCAPTDLKGMSTRILFDDAFDIPNLTGQGIKDELIKEFTIDACFDESNRWQFTIESEGVKNKIKLRILVTVCNWDEEDIASIDELKDISEEDACSALVDFEKNRPYPLFTASNLVPKKYIKDAAYNHEKTHVKFFQLDIKNVLKSKINFAGEIKSFKEFLKFSPGCTELFKDKDQAKRQSKQYYDKLLSGFVVKLKNKWDSRIQDEWTNENKTQWNKDVQSTIDYYQASLLDIWKKKGKPIKNCKYEMDWSEFEEYKNEF